jgi:hypothetical protein
MKVIKKDLISFEKNSVPISEVINLLEKWFYSVRFSKTCFNVNFLR